MNTLPASIEAYLKEAGFTSTEIIALKHLLEEDALTLRQLAAKTGKSTGVLDQSLRKLLQKEIVSKELINDNPKYILTSLRAITEWMENDMKEKREELLRRHRNFEAFIASVSKDRRRPEMEYFEGLEGLEQAYRKLLAAVPLLPPSGRFFQPTARGEMLHYFPVLCAVEDDPLRDFRVEEFRDRRRRGILARYIVHDTSLGRRFHSRDPFEYRQSILVPEEEHPFTFEKVITGNIVACFHHPEKRACFIRFPEFAESERRTFEQVWKRNTQKPPNTEATPEKESAEITGQALMKAEIKSSNFPSQSPLPSVSIGTRTFSGLREFFLSKTSLTLMVIFAVIAMFLTLGLHRYNLTAHNKNLHERAKAIVAMGALRFNDSNLQKLKNPEDMQRPEYAESMYKLNEIRRLHEDVKRIRIMLPTNDLNMFTFAVDADALDPYTWKDPYGNLDPEKTAWPLLPGDPFNASKQPALREAFEKGVPTTTAETSEDASGPFLSAYAPILDNYSKRTAILTIDLSNTHTYNFTRDSLKSFLTFISLFLVFILVRMMAFNRMLLIALIKALNLNIREVVYSIFISCVLALGITFGLYIYTLKIVKYEIGQRLMSIAATAAPEIDAQDLDSLRFSRDMKRTEYQKIFRKLNEIRNRNKNIRYAYILRPTENKDVFEFVADADSNYYLPFAVDYNSDGQLTEDEEAVAPGVRYVSPTQSPLFIQSGMNEPVAESELYSDQWGTFISGYAPIKNKIGKTVAVLEIDIEKESLKRIVGKKFNIFSIFFSLLFVLSAVIYRAKFFKMLSFSKKIRSTVYD